ncbi:MAG: hypothetical protein ACMUIG_08810 [Thermoplasmatota archaeon]
MAGNIQCPNCGSVYVRMLGQAGKGKIHTWKCDKCHFQWSASGEIDE